MPTRLPRRFALGLSLGLGLTLWGADPKPPATNPSGLFEDPVVARGTGFEIRQSEVDDMVTGLKSTLASTRNQTIPDQQRGQIATQMLDRLILTRMVQQRATDADKARAQELSARFVADTKAKARSEESYRRQLIASGIRPELFEARAYEQALVEVVIDREVKSKATIPDAQVRAFYDQGADLQAAELVDVLARLEKENGTNTTFYADGQKRLAEVKKANLDRLERPEIAKAQVIIVYTVDRFTRDELSDDEKALRKQRAEKALARLKAGEDFIKVAREVSEDPEVERNGGEYTTPREGVLYPELRAALFSQPPGELSDLIPTKVGYYIVKVLERTPAGKVPFDKAEKEIRDTLVAQEVQKRLPAFFDQMRKDFNVTYVTNAAAAK